MTEPRVRRRPKLTLTQAVFATAAFLVIFLLAEFTAIGAFAAIGLAILVSVFLELQSGRRQRQLQELSLHLDDSVLQQRDRSSRVVAEIRLNEPLTYEYLDRTTGFAIYRLRQDDAILDFASTAPEAEQIVTRHLGLPWPPTEGPTFTA